MPAAGETLDMNLAPACGGRLVIRFSLRCRDDNGDATRWASISLSDQPPSTNAFVTNSSNNPGILFRANGGIQCFRQGSSETPATAWSSDTQQATSLKLIISDSSGTGSPFSGNGSLARLHGANDALLAEWPLAQLDAGWLHIGAYQSLWEIDDLSVSTEVPGTDYQTWSQSLAAAGNGSSLTDPDADEDQDGLTNFTEYAFGLDPQDSASVRSVIMVALKDSGTLTYTRRKTSLTGLIYTVWTSTDLSSWTEDTGAAQTATAIPGTVNESVEVVLSPDLLDAPRLFVRITA
jgi:hypothetical protein